VLTQNIDKVLLGLWLGNTSAGQAIVGAYAQAYNLMMRPVYLVTTPLSGVLLPALSRAQDTPPLFADLTLRAFRLAALLLWPASIGLCLVARELMPILGGDKWRDAGVLLAALAPAIAMQAWINLCGSVLAAHGKTRLLCFGAIVLLVVTLQAIALGYFIGSQGADQPLGAALGVAVSITLATLVAIGIPYVTVCLTASGIMPKSTLRSAMMPLRNAILMGLGVYFAGTVVGGDFPSWPRVVTQIAAGVAIYGLLSWKTLSRAAGTANHQFA
jgi:O-antigen/teichoic acid export membrane protein